MISINPPDLFPKCLPFTISQRFSWTRTWQFEHQVKFKNFVESFARDQRGPQLQLSARSAWTSAPTPSPMEQSQPQPQPQLQDAPTNARADAAAPAASMEPRLPDAAPANASADAAARCSKRGRVIKLSCDPDRFLRLSVHCSDLIFEFLGRPTAIAILCLRTVALPFFFVA